MTAYGALAAYYALQISPLTKQEELLPPGHYILDIKDTLMNEFTETANSQDTLNVMIHWGISGLDRSETTMWDSMNSGKLIWDDNFTILPPENQMALLNFCQELRENEDLVFEGRVKCWLEEMQRFVEQISGG